MAVTNPFQESGFQDKTRFTGTKTGIAQLEPQRSAFHDLAKSIKKVGSEMVRDRTETRRESYGLVADLAYQKTLQEGNKYLSQVTLSPTSKQLVDLDSDVGQWRSDVEKKIYKMFGVTAEGNDIRSLTIRPKVQKALNGFSPDFLSIAVKNSKESRESVTNARLVQLQTSANKETDPKKVKEYLDEAAGVIGRYYRNPVEALQKKQDFGDQFVTNYATNLSDSVINNTIRLGVNAGAHAITSILPGWDGFKDKTATAIEQADQSLLSIGKTEVKRRAKNLILENPQFFKANEKTLARVDALIDKKFKAAEELMVPRRKEAIARNKKAKKAVVNKVGKIVAQMNKKLVISTDRSVVAAYADRFEAYDKFAPGGQSFFNLLDQKGSQLLEDGVNFMEAMKSGNFSAMAIETFNVLRSTGGFGVAVVRDGLRAVAPNVTGAFGFWHTLSLSEKEMLKELSPPAELEHEMNANDPEDKWYRKEVLKRTKYVTDPKTDEKRLVYRTWFDKVMNSPLAPKYEEYLRIRAGEEFTDSERSTINERAVKKLMLNDPKFMEQGDQYADQLEMEGQITPEGAERLKRFSNNYRSTQVPQSYRAELDKERLVLLQRVGGIIGADSAPGSLVQFMGWINNLSPKQATLFRQINKSIDAHITYFFNPAKQPLPGVKVQPEGRWKHSGNINMRAYFNRLHKGLDSETDPYLMLTTKNKINIPVGIIGNRLKTQELTKKYHSTKLETMSIPEIKAETVRLQDTRRKLVGNPDKEKELSVIEVRIANIKGYLKVLKEKKTGAK